MAHTLNRTVLTIKARAGAEDRLYGSVTSTDIADAIWKAREMRVDRRKVELEEPIKALGSYRVGIDGVGRRAGHRQGDGRARRRGRRGRRRGVRGRARRRRPVAIGGTMAVDHEHAGTPASAGPRRGGVRARRDAGLAPMPSPVVSEMLQPEDFYRRSHGLIFEAIRTMYAEGETVDSITRHQRAAEPRRCSTRWAARRRCTRWPTTVPAVANARRYAEIVRDASTYRSLIRAGTEIAELGYERLGEPPEAGRQGRAGRVPDRQPAHHQRLQPDHDAAARSRSSGSPSCTRPAARSSACPAATATSTGSRPASSPPT